MILQYFIVSNYVSRICHSHVVNGTTGYCKKSGNSETLAMREKLTLSCYCVCVNKFVSQFVLCTEMMRKILYDLVIETLCGDNPIISYKPPNSLKMKKGFHYSRLIFKFQAEDKRVISFIKNGLSKRLLYTFLLSFLMKQ